METKMLRLVLVTALVSLWAGQATSQDLPTVYQYYRGSETVSGLVAEGNEFFTLNGKPLRIVSGAIHYFRVHPDYWRDRLRRLRAIGANTVETYVPWNLHEPEIGVYDFGDGNRDMSPFLNFLEFIRIAEEEDLLVIFRPGPYICAEFEFGGLPSWLLRDPEMRVRSMYPGYWDRAKAYFDVLIPMIIDLQWQNGGPIILLQIENEFGAFGTEEKEHLEAIKALLEEKGVKELLFTSDSPRGARDKGAIPGVLQAANFRYTPAVQLDVLLELQPNRPVFVSEYWSGWFDYWFHPFHSHMTALEFSNTLETIFDTYNGSVNFYMFHGGTDFGFLNGANVYTGIYPYVRHHVTSYDYDAPLSESGRYNPKYGAAYNLIEQYKIVDLYHPEIPHENPRFTYPAVQIQEYLTFSNLVDQVPASLKTVSADLISMENLPINGNSGQSFGFVLYRKNNVVIGNGSEITVGRVRDELSLIVDGVRQNKKVVTNLNDLATEFGYWIRQSQSFQFQLEDEAERTLDLLVENWGRVNFGFGPEDFQERKGLYNQTVSVDGEELQDWEIIPLEFKGDWVRGLTGFQPLQDASTVMGPVLLQSTFTIEGQPQDTFLDMSTWSKGNVFVNGFNIGRYYRAGPTKTMYVAAPFLRTGVNTITVFELFQPGPEIVFSEHENLGPISPV